MGGIYGKFDDIGQPQAAQTRDISPNSSQIILLLCIRTLGPQHEVQVYDIYPKFVLASSRQEDLAIFSCT